METPSPTGVLAPPSDPELVLDFVTEARERLERVETDLRWLADDPTDRASVCAMYREFHTIKGLAAFLEFMEIRALAREMELLLDPIRREVTGFCPVTAELIEDTTRSLHGWLDLVEASMRGVR